MRNRDTDQDRAVVERDLSATPSGEFVDHRGERCYLIRDVDAMPPFLMSVVSNSDHWLFAASNGGLTAGRVSPETALFPYVSVDKVYDSHSHTGCISLFRVSAEGGEVLWEPFAAESQPGLALRRNLYKNLPGNKVWYEEIREDLGLKFSYSWSFSEEYGFVRQCELVNSGPRRLRIEVLDGFRNLLPAGTPRALQSQSSNLIDAYKLNELDEPTGLAVYSLYSGITDKPEPYESLRATTVFSLGLERAAVLLCCEQVQAFRRGQPVRTERMRRGVRGAHLVATRLNLAPGESTEWSLVTNVECDQVRILDLRRQLQSPAELRAAITASIESGSAKLHGLMAAKDAVQLTGDEAICAHHYANVVFNVLRGGAFVDQYNIVAADFLASVKHFNRPMYQRNRSFLASLPARMSYARLLEAVRGNGDAGLERLCREYLPMFFGRRHGDPSRPWNQFAIQLRDAHGRPLLSYQGNWRDIFQNWEATAYSYPLFVQNMIARFVNASTADGYNPYRISKEGIDWEVEDPEDPWSYIGYWGDHQVIYLLKLLELQNDVAPIELRRLLTEDLFGYANVPYRIKPFEDLLRNPKDTIEFDEPRARRIEALIRQVGMEGQLILDGDGQVYRVNLTEKLLVTLLAKLANLVLGGGIWMNTQRPEWNDANNALVGNGLSVVTLCYLRRYIRFLQDLLGNAQGRVALSKEVVDWLRSSSASLGRHGPELATATDIGELRHALLQELGLAAGRYRQQVYETGGFSGRREVDFDEVRQLLDHALFATDWSIRNNRRDDGLYHAYNLLNQESEGRIEVDHLYLMLEGQVAALSSGLVEADEAARIVESLFASDLHRADQGSFLLYPDRHLTGFLDRNRIEAEALAAVPEVDQVTTGIEAPLLIRDADGNWRFAASLTNRRALAERLEQVEAELGRPVAEPTRRALFDLYESVFQHRAYTGRSGGMFGFEGLGCIYWHMVSKLLLAVQECYFQALEADAEATQLRKLGALYYRVRKGLGFNKTPAQYGAFPHDPYSHSPAHAGAQQPGMTGQVKEEILTRFGELGVRLKAGRIHFQPGLLRQSEFLRQPAEFTAVNLTGAKETIDLPARSLAFTFCQVPVVYRLADADSAGLCVEVDGEARQLTGSLSLPEDLSELVFQRSGRVRRIEVSLPQTALFES